MNPDEISDGKENDLSKTREYSREEIMRSFRQSAGPPAAEEASPAGKEHPKTAPGTSRPEAGGDNQLTSPLTKTAREPQKTDQPPGQGQVSRDTAVTEQPRPGPPARNGNPAATEPKQEQSRSKPGLVIIPLALLFAVIIFLILTRSPEKQAPPVENTPAVLPQEQSRAENGQPPKTSVPATDYHQLDDRQLWGWAQLNQGESEIFSSAADDARLAALMQAMKNQADLVFNSRTVKKGEESVRTSSGSLAGCNLVIVETIDASGKADLEVSLTTPDRGSARSFNRRLTALKNLNLEQLETFLHRAGYLVEFDPAGENPERISVRLQKTTFAKVSEDFLIASNALGRIGLGTRVDLIEASAPPGTLVAMNRFRDGSRFQIIYKVYDRSQQEFLFAYEKDGRVAGIRPLNERYRTSRDIGLNSTLGNLLAAYGRVSFVIDTGNDRFALVPELDARLYFPSERIDFKAGRFPLDAPISDILIGRIPILGED